MCGLRRGDRSVSGLGEERLQSFQRPCRRARLRLHRLFRAAAEPTPFGIIFQKLHERERQFRYAHDPNRIPALKQSHDVAEILRVVPRHDRHPVLCRLDDIVPATGHQASTDERYIGQSIEGSQFSDVSTRNTPPASGSPCHRERR